VLRAAAPRLRLDSESADQMAADWGATIDVLLEEVGDVPVGYAGFSMGSYFGVPTVAAQPRIVAAALGLSGVSAGEGPGRAMADRLEADARRITCPLLFILQHDDEGIAFAAGLRQFEAFSSVHKRLHVNPGRHAQVPLDETPFIEMFIATHLLGGSRRSSLEVTGVLPVEAASSPRTLG
jgi:dienelactone hydrolase